MGRLWGYGAKSINGGGVLDGIDASNVFPYFKDRSFSIIEYNADSSKRDKCSNARNCRILILLHGPRQVQCSSVLEGGVEISDTEESVPESQ